VHITDFSYLMGPARRDAAATPVWQATKCSWSSASLPPYSLTLLVADFCSVRRLITDYTADASVTATVIILAISKKCRGNGWNRDGGEGRDEEGVP